MTTEKLTEQDIESVIDHCKHRIEVHNGSGGVSAREALAMAEELRRLRAENERLARERDEALRGSQNANERVRRLLSDHSRVRNERDVEVAAHHSNVRDLNALLTAATERAERAERERDGLLAELAEHMPIAIAAMKLSADQARMGDLRDVIDAIGSATPEQRLAHLAELRKEQP